MHSDTRLDSYNTPTPYLGHDEEEEDIIAGPMPDPKHVPRQTDEEDLSLSNATPRPAKARTAETGPKNSAGKLATAHQHNLRKNHVKDAMRTMTSGCCFLH
jgi:hypothetical protein